MQRVSAKLRLIPICGTIMAALMWSSVGFAQQSVEDNIRPIGQVCLAGQACAGSASGNAASAPAAAAPAPAAAPAVAAAPAAAPAASDFDVAGTYQMSCFACHGTGAAGAPKVGDSAAWAEKLEKGMDAVMANVTNGINAMPPKGLCMTCSDDNLRALVDYMVSQSQ